MFMSPSSSQVVVKLSYSNLLGSVFCSMNIEYNFTSLLEVKMSKWLHVPAGLHWLVTRC